MSFDRKSHWESVYGTKGEQEVSWFQENPQISLDLIGFDGLTRDSAIIDIGGGTSRLVDGLLLRGYNDLSVLDLSGAALTRAQARTGRRPLPCVGLKLTSRSGIRPNVMTSGTTAPFCIS